MLPTIAPEHNGFLTSSNESEANGSRPAPNGDIEMDNAEAVPSSAPLAGTSSQPYVTELKTEEETLAEEFECVMLAPEEEVEGGFMRLKLDLGRTDSCACIKHVTAKRTLFSKLLSQEVYSVEPSKLPVRLATTMELDLLAYHLLAGSGTADRRQRTSTERQGFSCCRRRCSWYSQAL